MKVLIVSADRSTDDGRAWNLGDAWLTDSLKSAVEDLGHEVKAVDFGARERIDSARVQIHGFRSLRHQCASADLVLVGGGTMLQDDSRSPVFGGLTRLCFASALAARAARKRVVIFGVGVDPISRRIPQVWTRGAVRLSDGVYLRDAESVRRLEVMTGVRAALSGDAALLRTDRPTITDDERRGHILALNRHDCARLDPGATATYLRRDSDLHFLSMDQGPESDWLAFLKVAGGQARQVAEGARLHWRQALAEVARAQWVAASRMHALYMAAVTGTPAVAVGKSAKVLAFAEEFGIPIVDPSGLWSGSGTPRAADPVAVDAAVARARVDLMSALR